MDKHITVYLHNRILLSNKNGTEYWYMKKIDECLRHYDKWKEPDLNGYILYDSISMMKCQ